MSDSKGAAIDEHLDFPEQFDQLWQDIETIADRAIDEHHDCGGGESAHIIANEVRQLLAQEVKNKLEKCLDFGSWLTGHCDLHERYTSACAGCQRELRAYAIVRDYQDYIRERLG